MQELNSKPMQRYLRRGLRKATHSKIPSDGTFINLIYETKKNGWHYQVELVNDSRFYSNPVVVVYSFKPPRTFLAKAANYMLEKEFVPRKRKI